jgi:ABC-type Zn uptake system ZnuABC Zn-binding protein ZnuA
VERGLKFLFAAFALFFVSSGAFAAPKVLASFSILADLAKQVVPAGVEVETLVEAGEDSHQYQVTGKDLRDMKNAQIILQIGQGFEPWLSKSLRSFKRAAKVFTITEDLSLRLNDPHVWQDPSLAKKIVQKIAEVFRQEFPAQKNEIDRLEAAFLKELDLLDQSLKKSFAEIPESGRVAITSHDAFGYFAQAYGLRLYAPQALSTESEPSAKAVAKIIRQIREQKARALFIEDLSNANVMQQIARETGARIGGTLYADSLSKPSGPAGTYLKLIRYNADTILTALRGTKP